MEEEKEKEKPSQEQVQREESKVNTFQSSQPSIYAKSQTGLPKPLVALLSLVVILLLGGTAYLVRGKLTGPNKIEPSPPSPKVEIAFPSPTPSFDRSKYSLRVLNGSGKVGLAASVSAKLKELGYAIDKTGNATNSAFVKTLVRVKNGVNNLPQQLIKDLSADFDSEEGGNLKDSDTVDGEVILGANVVK